MEGALYKRGAYVRIFGSFEPCRVLSCNRSAHHGWWYALRGSLGEVIEVYEDEIVGVTDGYDWEAV